MTEASEGYRGCPKKIKALWPKLTMANKYLNNISLFQTLIHFCIFSTPEILGHSACFV